MSETWFDSEHAIVHQVFERKISALAEYVALGSFVGQQTRMDENDAQRVQNCKWGSSKTAEQTAASEV